MGNEELDFRFRYNKFEMSVRHSCVNFAKVIGYMSVESRGKCWVKSIDMVVISFYIVLGAIQVNLSKEEGSIKEKKSKE